MAKWLMEERKFSLQAALSLVYNSRTFELLQNPATGLCTESSAYNYEMLDSELKNGKIVQMEI